VTKVVSLERGMK